MHSPGHDGAYVQFAADLAGINVLSFVTGDHTARYHSQLREFGQTVDEALRDFVVQVVSVLTSRVVNKRQHRDRFDGSAGASPGLPEPAEIANANNSNQNCHRSDQESPVPKARNQTWRLRRDNSSGRRASVLA